jgi:orotate phosphoribosyltransferase
MQEEIVDLLSGTRGHFRFESGHHGELWLELDSMFVRPGALARPVAELARRLSARDVEAVCGPLVGGAFLAQLLAARLGVEFFYSEPSAQPRRDALYSAEYRIPAALRARVRGRAVAVADDVVNAGSARE